MLNQAILDAKDYRDLVEMIGDLYLPLHRNYRFTYKHPFIDFMEWTNEYYDTGINNPVIIGLLDSVKGEAFDVTPYVERFAQCCIAEYLDDQLTQQICSSSLSRIGENELLEVE